MAHGLLEPSPEQQPSDPHEVFLNTAHGAFSEYADTGEVEFVWLQDRRTVPVIGGILLDEDCSGMTGVIRDLSKNKDAHEPDIAYRFDLFSEAGDHLYFASVNQIAGVGGWEGDSAFMHEDEFVDLNAMLDDLHFSKSQTAKGIELLQKSLHGGEAFDVAHWEPFLPENSLLPTRLRSLLEVMQYKALAAAQWLGRYSMYAYLNNDSHGYDPEI